MQAIALLLASLCLTVPPAASTAAQDARGAAVAPFIDDQTFVVGALMPRGSMCPN